MCSSYERISHCSGTLPWERINSGLDYLEWWNSGMVDWNVFVLDFIIYHIVSTLQIFLHLSSIRIPRF